MSLRYKKIIEKKEKIAMENVSRRVEEMMKEHSSRADFNSKLEKVMFEDKKTRNREKMSRIVMWCVIGLLFLITVLAAKEKYNNYKEGLKNEIKRSN